MKSNLLAFKYINKLFSINHIYINQIKKISFKYVNYINNNELKIAPYLTIKKCNDLKEILSYNIINNESNILNKEEVLIKVVSFGINRADLLQASGKYPASNNSSSILGLECSGYIVDNNLNIIDKNKPVMALLSGGGYSEYVKVNKKHIIHIPKEIDIVEAGGLPEAWITAYQIIRYVRNNNFDIKDYNILVSGAASGVGTALIQMIKEVYNANPIAMVGNEFKLLQLKKKYIF